MKNATPPHRHVYTSTRWTGWRTGEGDCEGVEGTAVVCGVWDMTERKRGRESGIYGNGFGGGREKCVLVCGVVR